MAIVTIVWSLRCQKAEVVIWSNYNNFSSSESDLFCEQSTVLQETIHISLSEFICDTWHSSTINQVSLKLKTHCCRHVQRQSRKEKQPLVGDKQSKTSGENGEVRWIELKHILQCNAMHCSQSIETSPGIQNWEAICGQKLLSNSSPWGWHCNSIGHLHLTNHEGALSTASLIRISIGN